MKDKDYFKIKIRKCRIKTPDMSIIEQEFKSPPPKVNNIIINKYFLLSLIIFTIIN